MIFFIGIVSTGTREPSNFIFDTIQRIMIVEKRKNMRYCGRLERKFCKKRDIWFGFIVERKELIAYPFNDIWKIVKRYGSENWYQTKMKCGADFTEKLNKLLLVKQ